MSNLFGLNLLNNTGYNPYGTSAFSAFQSQSFVPSNPFGSFFSDSSQASILPLVLRQSAGLQSGISGGDSSGLMQMMMLMKLLGGSGISQSVFNPVPQTPWVDPAELKKQQETAKLREETDAMIKNLKFNAEDLKALKADNGTVQYQKTVKKAYDINFTPNVNILGAGSFAGRDVNTIKTQELIDQKFLDKDWTWNVKDLEEAFAKDNGTLASTPVGYQKPTDLSAAISSGLAWHSTPFHLGQAQKLLDKSKAITEFMSKNGVTDSALEAQAKELKELASMHYAIGRTTHSPVIFDTDGNGKIDLTSVKDGVQFDIDGDGKKDQVAWTQAKGDKTDAWLALDRNGNGSIDSGKELFGNQHGLANGYEELKKFDDNKDGVIDSKDAIYAKLKTWKDTNHDGISQASEMQDLKSAGVESVNIGYKNSTEKDAHGNELRQQSAFTRTDAEAAKLAQSRGGTAAQFKSGLSVDAWVQTLRGA